MPEPERGQIEVLVCVGSSCRRAKGHKKLMRQADSSGNAFTIPCQGICRGPVIGVRKRDELRWYAKVRRRGRTALGVVLAGGGWRSLRTFEVRAKRGKIRHADKLERRRRT